MKKNIEVVPYSPEWPEMFALEAELIKQALGNNCITIHHIGSTSVLGLSAKPIIDILPVVRDIQEVDKTTKAMESLGYEAKGEYGIAFRRYFQKDQNAKTYNVHVYQEGDPEISRYLKFRDWMRSHPDDAENYAKLKEGLAAKFPEDILQYCNGKDAFVASIDAKDGFDGWRIVKALTDREWSAVRDLRQQYFFKWICPSGPVDSDSQWDPKENGFRPRILSRLKAFIDCSRNTGHLPKFCEASIQLLSHLKKIWPESRYIDVFPVFKEQNDE